MSGVRTMKCRLFVSRPFTFMDRLRVLFTGRVFISVANGKPHTTVVLSTRRPEDSE